MPAIFLKVIKVGSRVLILFLVLKKSYFMHCLSANGEILCMKTRAVSDPVENHLSCLRDVSA